MKPTRPRRPRPRLHRWPWQRHWWPWFRNRLDPAAQRRREAAFLAQQRCRLIQQQRFEKWFDQMVFNALVGDGLTPINLETP